MGVRGLGWGVGKDTFAWDRVDRLLLSYGKCVVVCSVVFQGGIILFTFYVVLMFRVWRSLGSLGARLGQGEAFLRGV